MGNENSSSCSHSESPTAIKLLCGGRFDERQRRNERMGTVTNISNAKFAVGDLIHHQLFNYRGVVVDMDSTYQSTEEWYETVARSRPPKNRPWYHVLVDGATHTTYVAERNLERDSSAEPISHPMLAHFFSKFEGGRYVSGARTN